MDKTIISAARVVAESLYTSGIFKGKSQAGAVLYAKRRAFDLVFSDKHGLRLYPYVLDAINTIEREL
jgi:hypothetical protein